MVCKTELYRVIGGVYYIDLKTEEFAKQYVFMHSQVSILKVALSARKENFFILWSGENRPKIRANDFPTGFLLYKPTPVILIKCFMQLPFLCKYRCIK